MLSTRLRQIRRIAAPLTISLVLAVGAHAQTPSAADVRLAEAAMKRDTASVRALVAQKVDVNMPGRDGTPPLHWLVRVDDLDTTRLLLSAGADASRPNRHGVAPLSLACANGNAAMISVLLDAGANANTADPAGETPLMTAAKVGSVEAVTVLLDRGAIIPRWCGSWWIGTPTSTR
jgi:ankyrin repeat protein